jgi:putative chitinase
MPGRYLFEAQMIETKLLTALDWVAPAMWSPLLQEHMARAGMTVKPIRAAMALANFAHETNGGRRLIESLDYNPDRLAAVFGARATTKALDACRRVGHPADQKTIAEEVYGGDWGQRNLGNKLPGDGWTYRGRGLIQLTGRWSYARVAGVLQRELTDDWVESIGTPAGAAESACIWWSRMGLNDLADKGDLGRVRKAVNGGHVGLDDVKRRYELARALLVG